MSTRSKTLIINREESARYVAGFAVNPSYIADKSFINMYLHHDGYPQFRGVELSNWINHKISEGWAFGDESRISAQLAHDFYYSSQYLYPNTQELDVQYTYIIWAGKQDVWISCWSDWEDKCEFVGTPDKLISKYKKEKDFKYTNWKHKLNTKLDR